MAYLMLVRQPKHGSGHRIKPARTGLRIRPNVDQMQFTQDLSLTYRRAEMDVTLIFLQSREDPRCIIYTLESGSSNLYSCAIN
jgi:hypothetical protein